MRGHVTKEASARHRNVAGSAAKVGPLDCDATLRGKMPDTARTQVILALAARSTDSSWEVRSTAMDALARIAESLSDPSRWTDGADGWHEWHTARATTAAQINALQSDPEPEVRRAAATASVSLRLNAADALA